MNPFKATFYASYWLFVAWLEGNNWGEIEWAYFGLALKYNLRAWIIFLPLVLVDTLLIATELVELCITCPLNFFRWRMENWCDWHKEAHKLDRQFAEDHGDNEDTFLFTGEV